MKLHDDQIIKAAREYCARTGTDPDNLIELNSCREGLRFVSAGFPEDWRIVAQGICEFEERGFDLRAMAHAILEATREAE